MIVIRERYLRDDVSCGIDACPKCLTDVEAVLSVHGLTGHPAYSTGHILVPDTNIFLRQVSERTLPSLPEATEWRPKTPVGFGF